MNTYTTPYEEGDKTSGLASELDELLKAAVERGTALKMPKPKLHWKQAAQKGLQASRRHEARESTKAYRERQARSLRRKYHKLKTQVGKQGTGWELSLDEWLLAWTLCAPTDMGRPAWTATGRRQRDVKLSRNDTSLPYNFDNIKILQNDRQLWP